MGLLDSAGQPAATSTADDPQLPRPGETLLLGIFGDKDPERRNAPNARARVHSVSPDVLDQLAFAVDMLHGLLTHHRRQAAEAKAMLARAVVGGGIPDELKAAKDLRELDQALRGNRG